MNTNNSAILTLFCSRCSGGHIMSFHLQDKTSKLTCFNRTVCTGRFKISMSFEILEKRCLYFLENFFTMAVKSSFTMSLPYQVAFVMYLLHTVLVTKSHVG